MRFTTFLALLLLVFFPSTYSASVYDIKKSMPPVVIVESYTLPSNARSSGTGFFVDSNHIVTNYHIIEHASHIRIKTYFHGSHFPLTVKVIAQSRHLDIAILKTNLSYPHFARLNTSKVELGDDIFVIGNLYGLEFSVTKGSIVNKSKDNKMYFIDAVIHHGNSGSPVFNKNGDVIGMIKSSLYSEKDIPIGISTVIPSQLILDTKSGLTSQNMSLSDIVTEKNVHQVKNYLQYSN